jgi:paraquat-inducible protein B
MSARANPTMIGAFVVGAAVLVVVALLVWGGTGFLNRKLDYVLVFDSAVTGLQKGAPVMLRGVRVGEVTTCRCGGGRGSWRCTSRSSPIC